MIKFFDGIFNKPAQPTQANTYTDGILTNIVSGFGVQGYDKNQGFTVSTGGKMSPLETEAIYFDTFCGKKAVDIIADDMTREWRIWQHDKAELIYAYEKKIGLQEAINKALKAERRTGGALVLMKTREADVSKELPENAVIDSLDVFSADEVAALQWDSDTSSLGYGTPLTYQLKTPEYVSQGFHRSRFLIFKGADTTRENRKNNNGFGESILRHIKEPCYAVEKTRAAIAHLVQEANIDVIKHDGLENRLSTIEGQSRFRNMISTTQSTKGIFKQLWLDAKDQYDRKPVSLAGLTEIQMQQIQIVAAGCDIPLVRFMGSSPTGLGSSGAQETRSYYDNVRAKQNVYLTNTLKPIDDRIINALKIPPQDVSFEWKSLWALNEVDAAKVALDMARVDQIYTSSGLFDTKQLAEAVKDRLVEAGTYPTADVVLKPSPDDVDVDYSELPDDEEARRGA